MSEQEEIIISDIMSWIDLETTGFDENENIILEVAMIITDNQLNELGRYTSVVVDADPDKFLPGDQVRTRDDQIVVWENHWKTNLIQDIEAVCDKSDVLPNLEEVENNLISLMNAHGIDEAMIVEAPRKLPPMCGSTVSFDRKYIKKYWPELNRLFTYRNIDVSSIRELQKRWRPEIPSPPKSEKHRAEADIEESINYLKHFRSSGFIG